MNDFELLYNGHPEDKDQALGTVEMALEAFTDQLNSRAFFLESSILKAKKELVHGDASVLPLIITQQTELQQIYESLRMTCMTRSRLLDDEPCSGDCDEDCPLTEGLDSEDENGFSHHKNN